MKIHKMTPKTETEIIAQVREHKPSLYLGSKTSTVMPYDYEEQLGTGLKELYLVDLSSIRPEIELDEHNNMIVRGPSTWKDAREFCRSKGRMVMTSPTEDLAQILAGIATSCTGERCFGLGTLREQLNWVRFIDFQGNSQTLYADQSFLSSQEVSETDKKLLNEYQQSYRRYQNFKNAPFPRFEKETDLMTGTEGQLGVIVEASMKTIPAQNLTYLFVKLPKWEKDFRPHLEIYQKVQKFRDRVFACELLDENSLSYLPDEMTPYKGSDLIFLEMAERSFESIYTELISKLEWVQDEDFFSLDEAKCKELRVSVPRSIFEANSKMGVIKQGTDVQVLDQDFERLLEFYRKLSQMGISYNLFGHFGDGHLHFNFMPTKDLVGKCQTALKELYHELPKWKASPFAEHGIGLIKRPYIEAFYTPAQRPVFDFLKKRFDPYQQFFPNGYMSKESHL